MYCGSVTGVLLFVVLISQGCQDKKEGSRIETEDAQKCDKTPYTPDPKRNLLGIGGGVGPMAGVGLHKKLIQNTKTDGTDQSHFTIHHLSQSEDVLDRTQFLEGKITENPGDGMAKVMKSLKAGTMEYGGKAVVGVPCNTFHVPKIWNQFLKKMEEDKTTEVVTPVHMLEETLKYIKDKIPEVKKIGLMSTTGTRQSRVYHELLKDYEVIEVNENETQAELHDSIYNKDWGIKAKSSPVTDQAKDNFKKYTEEIIQKGAEAVILGCTEIPLVLTEQRYDFDGKQTLLVDPVDALARAMIKKSDPSKLN